VQSFFFFRITLVLLSSEWRLGIPAQATWRVTSLPQIQRRMSEPLAVLARQARGRPRQLPPGVLDIFDCDFYDPKSVQYPSLPSSTTRHRLACSTGSYMAVMARLMSWLCM
jgi:hypothetical protein